MDEKKKRRIAALSAVLRYSKGILDLREWRYLAAVLRYPNSHEDAVLSSAVVPCGERRFKLWNAMVDFDQNVVQFRAQTEQEAKDLRRRPPRQLTHLKIDDEDDEVICID